MATKSCDGLSFHEAKKINTVTVSCVALWSPGEPTKEKMETVTQAKTMMESHEELFSLDEETKAETVTGSCATRCMRTVDSIGL